MMGRVYDIGDFRVEVKQDYGGLTYDKDKECHHRNLTFAEEGQVITCDDCKVQVTAWWAFLSLTKKFADIQQRTQEAYAAVEASKARNLTHKAAIAVEDAWRGRKMIPTCPHCSKPILAQDGFGGSRTNREMSLKFAKPMEFRAGLDVVGGYRSIKLSEENEQQ